MKKITHVLSAAPRLPLRSATIFSGILLIAMTCWRMEPSSGAQSAATSPSSRASFAKDGTASLPAGFRRWEHVGTRVKTDGRSILDGTVILRPQVLDSYVEPTAFVEYKKTGAWPEGTQIVKELSVIRIGADCDKMTFSCTTPAGDGIFEDSYIGVGMMVKDRKRFPDAPGNWGYFRFLASGAAYATTSPVLPANQCQSCHVKYASKEDYVFTDTHIGLTSANVR